VVAAGDPEAGSDAATLDQGGVTSRIVTLAATVAGSGPVAEKATRLERYLIDNYTYTLDVVGGAEGPGALEAFLFDHRSGYCEYFATALVLMLRSQGIHSRLVAGFLGGERNALGYYVVRQSNAHVWVEAWVPDEGWRLLDPTPPAGRPGFTERGLWSLGAQLYDSLVFRWDRRVLSYGEEDQAEAVRRLLVAALGLWRSLRGEGPAASPSQTAAATAEEGVSAATRAADATRGPWVPALITALTVALGLLVWRRLRPPLTATRAYQRLRRQLVASGLPLADSTGPLAVAVAVADAPAPAAAPARRIVGLYLRESFGGTPLEDGERGQLRDALVATRRALAGRRAVGGSAG
jgi:hypothetical protein